MAETFSGALRASASLTGTFMINISTDNVEVPQEVYKIVGRVAVGLGAQYTGYNLAQQIIKGAVTKKVGGKCNHQDVCDFRPECLHVVLHCFATKDFWKS